MLSCDVARLPSRQLEWTKKTKTFVSPVDVVGLSKLTASTSPVYLLFPDIGGFRAKSWRGSTAI